MIHKKVLLRECKRYTVHHVASARSAVLSGGYPILTWPGGVLQSCTLPGLGYLPSWDWGTSPCQDRGTPSGQDWDTPPPQKGPGKESGTGAPPVDRVLWDVGKYYAMGYPPFPPCEQTENITFPILRMWEVTMAVIHSFHNDVLQTS